MKFSFQQATTFNTVKNQELDASLAHRDENPDEYKLSGFAYSQETDDIHSAAIIAAANAIGMELTWEQCDDWEFMSKFNEGLNAALVTNVKATFNPFANLKQKMEIAS